MLSGESLLIFDRAAEFIRGRLGQSENVSKVLSSFRQRINESDTVNPLENRELFIETAMDAQMIGVPREAIEDVTSELRRLKLLSVWVRAECPIATDDDNTIIETTSPKEFRESLHSPCPHCANLHESLDWDSLTTVYAFNLSGKPDTFRLSRFIVEEPKLPSEKTKGPSLISRAASAVGKMFRFFKRRERPPDEQITEALKQNGPPIEAPSQSNITKCIAVTISVTLVVATIIVAVIWRYSQPAALLAAATFVLAVGLLSAAAVKLFWMWRKFEVRVLSFGGTFAALLLLKSTGIYLSSDGKLTPDKSGGFEQALNMLVPDEATWHFRCGDCDHHCMWAGAITAMFAMVIALVAHMRQPVR